MAFFALMLSIGYEVEVSPPEGTQVNPFLFLLLLFIALQHRVECYTSL